MAFSALGIVFGDIGTSPLYTFKTVLAYNNIINPFVILGSLSLILWTLLIVTSLKYVNVALRIDNNGEGGILALMTLLSIKVKPKPIIITMPIQSLKFNQLLNPTS